MKLLKKRIITPTFIKKNGNEDDYINQPHNLNEIYVLKQELD